MTKQQKLQEIEQQIRKDIPRLMELTEGCKFHSGYGVETIVCIKGDKEDVFIFKDLFSNVYETNGIPQHYKIIGHEIMLNDWFEWLLNINPDLYYFAIEGNALAFYEDTEHIKDVLINLSKPYLKDQSEELINFLHNLKNQ